VCTICVSRLGQRPLIWSSVFYLVYSHATERLPDLRVGDGENEAHTVQPVQHAACASCEASEAMLQILHPEAICCVQVVGRRLVCFG